jgi:hypothetical protein
MLCKADLSTAPANDVTQGRSMNEPRQCPDIGAGAHAPAAYDKSDERFTHGALAATKAMEGVPVLGALTQKAGAAVSALAHPLTGVGSDGSSFSDRYSKNLDQENAASEAFDREHPIESGFSKALGGTLALNGKSGNQPSESPDND